MQGIENKGNNKQEQSILKLRNMKKYLFLAVAALAFAACSNEENEVTTDNWNGEIRLSSGNIAVPASRSLSQELQLTQFDEDELVGVFVNENVTGGVPSTTYTQPLVCTVGADNSSLSFNAGAQYFPQSGKGVNIYGVYPSSAVTGRQVDGNIDFSVQTNQSADANYKASDLMIGAPASNPVSRTKDPVNLSFTHKLAKIDITLIQGVGSPTLAGATVKIMNVLPTISFVPNTGSISAAKGSKTDVIAADANIDGTLKCSAIIVPQTIGDGSAFIEVTLASGGVLTYKLEAETIFEGTKKYTYNITVNLTELTVTSTITPWGNGSTTPGNAEMD